MGLALVLSAGLGVATFAWRTHVQARYGRPAPPLDLRFEAAARKLAEPRRVSPSEEFPASNGRTIFLTEDEARAVQLAVGLSDGLAEALAVALTEPSQEARLEALATLPLRPGTTDKDQVALYKLVAGALRGLPPNPRRDAVRAELDEAIGCRFEGPLLPPCKGRPSPKIAILLGGAAATPTVTIAVATLAAFVRRRRARV